MQEIKVGSGVERNDLLFGGTWQENARHHLNTSPPGMAAEIATYQEDPPYFCRHYFPPV